MHNFEEDSKVVGTKQTLRALEKGHARVVFVAKDASPAIRTKIEKSAKTQAVEVVYYDSMKQLGEACAVAVKTATAAIVS